MVKMHRFLIMIKKADRNYSAISPDLPGCVATGRTRDQVARNMHEAIDLHVRGLLEDRLPGPRPAHLPSTSPSRHNFLRTRKCL